MRLGYARVSTTDQTLEPQLDLLRGDGCEKFFTDVVTGISEERVGLSALLREARKGDVIVVMKLDRLGRSLKHLIDVMGDLEKRGVGLKSVSEGIDTTTSGGRLVFHIFGAIAEFERALIIERTQAGLQAARARGRRGGRPRKLGDAKVKTLLTMSKDESLSVSDICRMLSIGKDTYYRYMREGKKKLAGKEPSTKG
jgi:DNA invertase Pin-like site-specific DNA recombinase